MSPPELTRDTPVMDVFQPVHIDFVEALWYDFHQTILNRTHGWCRQWHHLDKPLLRNERFNHSVAALAVTQRHHVVFSLHNQTKPIQLFYQIFTSFVAILSCKWTCLIGHLCIKPDDLHEWKIMAYANFKVYGIMGRSHFYS